MFLIFVFKEKRRLREVERVAQDHIAVSPRAKNTSLIPYDPEPFSLKHVKALLPTPQPFKPMGWVGFMTTKE